MISRSVRIPEGYQQASTWSHSQAAPIHALKYASRMYKTMSAPRNMGRGRTWWIECMKYGHALRSLLLAAPWQEHQVANDTTFHGGGCMTENWSRKGDFVFATFEWVVVVIDLTTAQVAMVYFNGARLHQCEPTDYMEHQDKVRQLEQGTWPAPDRTPKAASVYQWPVGFTGHWPDGSSISIGD